MPTRRLRSQVWLDILVSTLRDWGFLSIQFIFAIIAVLIVLALVALIYWPAASNFPEISYSQLLSEIDAGRVRDVLIQGSQVQGSFIEGKQFHSTIPNDPTFIQTLYRKNVIITAKENNLGSTSLWLLAFLAGGIVAGWVFRRSWRGQAQQMGIGRSPAKLLTEAGVRVTFDDIGGASEAKQKLIAMVEYLRDPGLYQRLGGRIPKGILLSGGPGRGKTLLTRALADEANVPFFIVTGSQFVEAFVGVGAGRIRAMFEQVKKSVPCILFIDELDAIGFRRDTGSNLGAEERDQTLQQLLSELDGFEAGDGIIVIAATDRPELLDPALTRAGRFDQHAFIPMPDAKDREEILKVHVRKIPLAPDVNLKSIARLTAGFTGADLSNSLNEAALMAAQRRKRMVTMADIQEACLSERNRIISKDSLLPSGTANAEVILRVARYTAGQVLAARSFGILATEVVIATGTPLDSLVGEKFTQSATREEVEALIVAALAGRSAESQLSSVTTIGQRDLEFATMLAEKFVKNWGFGVSLSSRTFTVGTDLQLEQPQHTGELVRKVEREISDLLARCRERANAILQEDARGLEILLAALLTQTPLFPSMLDDLLIEGHLPSEN